MATREEARELARPLSSRDIFDVSQAEDELMRGSPRFVTDDEDELMRSPVFDATFDGDNRFSKTNGPSLATTTAGWENTQNSYSNYNLTGNSTYSDELDVLKQSHSIDKHSPQQQQRMSSSSSSSSKNYGDNNHRYGDGGSEGDDEEEGSEYEDDEGEPELLVISQEGDGDEYLRDSRNGKVANEEANITLLPSEQTAGRIYQNPLCRPMFKAGNTEIGISQAKLYGLLDENGEICLKKPGQTAEVTRDKAEMMKIISNISKPRELDLSHIIDEEQAELTFKPVRNKASEAAMRNPRCGYDFVDRLNERGDFLDRALGSATDKKASKKALESEKEDYEARLDKLACPSCKREQSFDEFYEKKRSCGQCKERFVKLKVFNANSFEKRMKEATLKKEAKLAAIDAIMYGNTSAAAAAGGGGKMKTSLPPPPASASASASKTSIGSANSGSGSNYSGKREKENDRNRGTRNTNSGSGSSGSSRNNSSSNIDQLQQLQEKLLQSVSNSNSNSSSANNGIPTAELLQKMSELQQEKSDLLTRTLNAAEKKYSTGGNNNSNGIAKTKTKAIPSSKSGSAGGGKSRSRGSAYSNGDGDGDGDGDGEVSVEGDKWSALLA